MFFDTSFYDTDVARAFWTSEIPNLFLDVQVSF